MSGFDYKEIKEKDITWYFAIRIFIIVTVAISYIMSILKNIEYTNFAVISCIYFLPFILDYALKDTNSSSRKFQKIIGVCFPALSLIFLISVNLFGYEYFNLSTKPTDLLVKLIFIVFSVGFVLFAFLDFNYYAKNNKEAIKDRSVVKVNVDDEFKESFMDAMRKLETDKKEGLKSLAIKSSNQRRDGK